jgi:acyl-coenzyme A synthetase/AMP-(fatty) acid ligase
MHGKLDQQKLPALKRILFAGEVFPSKYLRQLMTLLPTVDYFNLYGPTETNVITYHHVQELPGLDIDIPIGSLCSGVNAYIVSKSGSLVAQGEIGELYVKSPTLMDGYWRDEQKTKDVILKNPYLSKHGVVYKTGDLVHWNKKGLLVYHGRCDSMIKSRGYRIELGEIETVLLAHEKIKEVVVSTIPSEEFGNIIKAVLVTKIDADLNETTIQRFCAETLPAYMVPENIHIVQALPRTSTGKIDRKAISDSGI